MREDWHKRGQRQYVTYCFEVWICLLELSKVYVITVVKLIQNPVPIGKYRNSRVFRGTIDSIFIFMKQYMFTTITLPDILANTKYTSLHIRFIHTSSIFLSVYIFPIYICITRKHTYAHRHTHTLMYMQNNQINIV